MKGKPAPLRTQLSRSMILTAFTALGIFSFGMVVFYVFLQRTWLGDLSAENKATLQTLMDDGTVSEDALTTLVSTFSFAWGGGYAQAELLAFIVLIIFAALCTVVIGLTVSKRLSAPIETVTDAALKIAGGNFKLELPEPKGGVAETEELMSVFKTMAAALDAAERETTESSAAIAHELRTPLTILRGRLQGIRDGAFEISDEMTDGLIGQVDTLSSIVDELSLLSRLSAGRFELQMIEIDLVEEVNRVIAPMRPDLEVLGFDISLPTEPVRLVADPERIRQVLAALIENAKRYASEGQYLEISAFTHQGHAHLEVTDHGPGINPTDRAKVFELWWRGEQSRSRGEGGSGLGLSVVKSIVTAHGGEVSVESNQLSDGVTFAVQLPLNLTHISRSDASS